MTNHKEKQARLGACFKELLRQHPFHKVSVKMITDRAGMSRSAFYKYFSDKYELLIFIAEYEIMRKVDMLLEAGMLQAAVELLFRSIVNEADFFRSAFAVVGQNSFENGFNELVQRSIKRLLLSSSLDLPAPSLLTPDNLALYYSFSITQSIKAWVFSKRAVRVEEMMEAYLFLNEHTLFELLQGENAKKG